MKRLLYDLRIIDLPQTQWRPRRPWLVQVVLGVLAFALALPTTLLARLLTNAAYSEARLRLKAGRVDCGIRIVAVAGRAAARVIWGDLAYEIAGALVGKGMEGMSYA